MKNLVRISKLHQILVQYFNMTFIYAKTLTNFSPRLHPQVKLFWNEVREDMIPATVERTIWDELPSANVDTTKLEHLFESRAKDLQTKVRILLAGLFLLVIKESTELFFCLTFFSEPFFTELA